MNEKICRLCLQTISGSCQPVGRSLKDVFELNMDISKEAVKCSECAINLEVFLKFKSACDYIGEMTLPPDIKNDIKLDPEIDITDNLISLEESKNEAKCCFCTKTCEREFLTSLSESKEHTFLVDVLKEHVPKLNTSITEELLTCDTCIDALQDVVSFVTKCLDVEQKISKYTEVKGTDDNGQIELKDVQQFVFKSAVKMEMEFKGENELKESYGQFPEECATQAEDEIKHEQDTENPELFIKTEDIDIKSEASDCDSFQESATTMKIGSGPLDISEVKSQGIHKISVNQHELTYKNSDGITIYKCKTCLYKTKHEGYLNRHKLAHRSISEVTLFKCGMCTYETKRKFNLRQHKLSHDSFSENVTIFECDLCPYETRRKLNLNRHKLRHKNTSEVTMFKCELCPFETKHKHSLKQHTLIHKNPSEITIFKCDLCPYETRRRQRLKMHELTHKSFSDVTVFRCKICTYKTKRKDALTRHELSHYRMYKCNFCPYEAKRKDHLNQHELLHKNTADITKFKCELCPYEAKHRQHLKRHTLTHKNPSEITIFKCELCPYKANFNYNVKRHELTHKSPLELTMFKCDLCSYEGKQLTDLKRHKLAHSSDATVFECELCPYKIKSLREMKGHQLTH